MPDQVNKNKIISKKEYIAPEYMKKAFHCPHCGVYSNQRKYNICIFDSNLMREKIYNYIKLNHSCSQLDESVIHRILVQLNNIYSELYIHKSEFIFCDHCKKYSIWVDEKIVYPDSPTAPLPVEDMPEPVKKLYNEARGIVNKSPRGACALLRLAIQLLIKELGEDETHLKTAIENLGKKGLLPEKIQKALDFVRVIGNNAVHPGTIDIEDNKQIVDTLFKLVNIICERTITANKQMDEVFNTLLETKKRAIENRDNTVNNNKG